MLPPETPSADCHTGAVEIPGPQGLLEGKVDCPEGTPRGLAVVCHPHPLHGGTMGNKVVHYLAGTFNGLGLVAVRFNFRGVGNSAGEYGEAIGETDDLHAVVEWARARWPDLPLSLAGFSFGAYVALRAAPRWPVRQLLTVAPPVNFFDFRALPRPDVPWLLVQGDDDEIVPADQVLAWANGLSAPPELITMSGTGHFFHGRLNDLREELMARLGGD